jgi:hypothetical protein
MTQGRICVHSACGMRVREKSGATAPRSTRAAILGGPGSMVSRSGFARPAVVSPTGQLMVTDGQLLAHFSTVAPLLLLTLKTLLFSRRKGKTRAQANPLPWEKRALFVIFRYHQLIFLAASRAQKARRMLERSRPDSADRGPVQKSSSNRPSCKL